MQYKTLPNTGNMIPKKTFSGGKSPFGIGLPRCFPKPVDI
jgi:hypothetical protein